MNKKVIFGIVILSLLITGCASTGQVVKEDTIKIGVFSVLSGEAAIYGQAIKNGMEIAKDDINRQGGVLGRKIELVYEDTHLDSKLAVTVMNKFVNIDKFPIVISGEGSGATLAAAPLADQTNTLMMVAIASTPDIKESGDYVFRVIPSDDYQGVEMARLAGELDYSKAAVLYVNDAFGFGIKNVFEKEYKEKTVASEAFEPGATDFRTHLTKIKALNPELMIVIARTEFPNILKQAKELGLNTGIITSGEFKDESLVEASGKAAEEVLVPFYAETKDYVDFAAKFKAIHGTEPALFSDYGYDALKAVAEAIDNAQTTNPTRVKDALYKTEFKGATGTVKFDENGEVIGKPFVIYKVKNGEFVEKK
ncbi:ABC transporter substrate-binding protein [Candidatus Woesearchaeota archaeon]|nr:ABC transporter substrate-binding protein [Candidatus Woesearchaeota archaeon]